MSTEDDDRYDLFDRQNPRLPLFIVFVYLVLIPVGSIAFLLVVGTIFSAAGAIDTLPLPERHEWTFWSGILG